MSTVRRIIRDEPENSADSETNNQMTFETSENVSVVNSFESLGLKEDLLRGIYAYSK
jgi:PDZ domain-containing secreted protein